LALISDQTFEGEYDESVFERLKMLAMEKLPGTHETDSELLARAKSFKSQLIKTEKTLFFVLLIREWSMLCVPIT
jgi:hypothetical protein